MSYLLYCIFRKSGAPALAPVPGVFEVAGRSLACAASVLGPDTIEPGAGRLRNYAQAIAAYHADRTIIPLRYGCAAENSADIARLLDDHEAEYEGVIARLAGKVEMGLRVLCAAVPEVEAPADSGARYLELARRRWRGLTPDEECWAACCCDRFHDLYTEARREARAAPGGRLVSLYFLIAALRVPQFRERARGLGDSAAMKLLETGPWPPYNFVDDVNECVHKNSERATDIRVGV